MITNLIYKVLGFLTKTLGMNDKHLHFLGNFLLFLILTWFRNTEVASWSCFWLSVGKEVGDFFNKESGGYAGDLLADFIGIITGYLFIVAIRAIFGV